MKKILVSGLVNIETTVPVHGFPISYYPIDYPFFGVETAVSGVGYNIVGALTRLGDAVTLCSMTGRDFPAEYIRRELEELGVSSRNLQPSLRATPSSVVLYDREGKRQVYCDLKDIQGVSYDFGQLDLSSCDLVAACNINFNRPLLAKARAAGKKIATDVHVIHDIYDEYDREFLEYADIVFLSDEGLGPDYRGFLETLGRTYGSELVVLGRGSRGAAMYQRTTGEITEMPAAYVGPIVNTVGAGDALFSAFLHFYAAGLAPTECLRRAQVFAAAKIRVSGAAKGFVTEAELEKLL